tara:strand:+ start:643 stop:789 length:147 start_codon:yes stop_codon:yes gene_type:complete
MNIKKKYYRHKKNIVGLDIPLELLKKIDNNFIASKKILSDELFKRFVK